MVNVTETMRIIEVIEATRFDTFPERWRCRDDYDFGIVERVARGAHFLYYNIHVGHAITENEA